MVIVFGEYLSDKSLLSDGEMEASTAMSICNERLIS